jgi:tetratricopeptide (TPR) repeat protein
VKGRKVFGGLVPYGEVWRTGANAATQIIFRTPVKLNGKDVPAGTFGLFTIPGEKEWTIIINAGPEQWGSYSYDAAKDIVRVTATPVALAEPVETFTIDINDVRDESATLNLVWEKTRVSVKIEVDLKTALVPQIEATMAAGGERLPYAQAAMFYYENNIDLAKAVAWMDRAIEANPKAFYLIYRKGLILAKAGDKAGAKAAAEKSIEVAKEEGGPVRDEYLRLNEELLTSLK